MKIAENQIIDFKEFKKLFQGKLPYKQGSLKKEVEKILAKKEKFLALTKKYPTPFYVFDNESFTQNCRAFKTSFQKYIP